MRRIKKLFLRCLALTLAITLTGMGIMPLPASAQVMPLPIQSHLPDDLAQFRLPLSLGKIDDLKIGKDGRVVILIQDAHAIPDAQGSIQKTIAYLHEVYGVQHVAVEGTANRLDPTLFKSFPDKVVLKKLFKEYFDQGELTGTSAAALFNSGGAIYEGVEDWDVYEQGLALYLSALNNQPGLLEYLKSEKENLEIEKQKIYSKKLLQVDGLISQFFLDQSDLISTLKGLAKFEAPPVGSDMSLMLEEAKREGSDQVEIEIEVKKVAEQIRKAWIPSLRTGVDLAAEGSRGSASPLSLPRKTGEGRVGELAIKVFNGTYQEYQTGQMTAQAFAAFLKKFCARNGIKVRFSKALRSSANKQVRLEQVEGTKFFREFKTYAKGIKEKLFENDTQRSLDRESDQAGLLERLALMKLDQEDWQTVSSGELSVQNTAFRDALLPAVAFYQNAKKRDAILFRNLMKQMDKAKSNAGILVAGGFHTEGLAQRLAEAGISFVVIMPGIRELPKDSHYVEQMRGDVSWRTELKVENGKIDLYGAFARYTRDRLLGVGIHESPLRDGVLDSSVGAYGHTPLLLKTWRDQILRDLAAEGRLNQAAQYTHFLDDVVDSKNSGDDLKTAWLKNTEKFMGQIKDLKSTNQLNQASVAKLFAPSGMASSQTAGALSPDSFLPLVPGAVDLTAARELFSDAGISGTAKSAARSEVRQNREVSSLVLSLDKDGRLAPMMPEQVEMPTYDQFMDAFNPSVKVGIGSQLSKSLEAFAQPRAGQKEFIRSLYLVARMASNPESPLQEEAKSLIFEMSYSLRHLLSDETNSESRVTRRVLLLLLEAEPVLIQLDSIYRLKQDAGNVTRDERTNAIDGFNLLHGRLMGAVDDRVKYETIVTKDGSLQGEMVTRLSQTSAVIDAQKLFVAAVQENATKRGVVDSQELKKSRQRFSDIRKLAEDLQPGLRGDELAWFNAQTRDFLTSLDSPTTERFEDAQKLASLYELGLGKKFYGTSIGSAALSLAHVLGIRVDRRRDAYNKAELLFQAVEVYEEFEAIRDSVSVKQANGSVAFVRTVKNFLSSLDDNASNEETTQFNLELATRIREAHKTASQLEAISNDDQANRSAQDIREADPFYAAAYSRKILAGKELLLKAVENDGGRSARSEVRSLSEQSRKLVSEITADLSIAYDLLEKTFFKDLKELQEKAASRGFDLTNPKNTRDRELINLFQRLNLVIQRQTGVLISPANISEVYVGGLSYRAEGNSKRVYEIPLVLPTSDGGLTTVPLSFAMKRPKEEGVGMITYQEVTKGLTVDRRTGYDGSVTPVTIQVYRALPDANEVIVIIQEFVSGDTVYNAVRNPSSIDHLTLWELGGIGKAWTEAGRFSTEDGDYAEFPTDLNPGNIMFRRAGRNIDSENPEFSVVDFGSRPGEKNEPHLFILALANQYVRGTYGRILQKPVGGYAIGKEEPALAALLTGVGRAFDSNPEQGVMFLMTAISKAGKNYWINDEKLKAAILGEIQELVWQFADGTRADGWLRLRQENLAGFINEYTPDFSKDFQAIDALYSPVAGKRSEVRTSEKADFYIEAMVERILNPQIAAQEPGDVKSKNTGQVRAALADIIGRDFMDAEKEFAGFTVDEGGMEKYLISLSKRQSLESPQGDSGFSKRRAYEELEKAGLLLRAKVYRVGKAQMPILSLPVYDTENKKRQAKGLQFIALTDNELQQKGMTPVQDKQGETYEVFVFPHQNRNGFVPLRTVEDVAGHIYFGQSSNQPSGRILSKTPESYAYEFKGIGAKAYVQHILSLENQSEVAVRAELADFLTDHPEIQATPAVWIEKQILNLKSGKRLKSQGWQVSYNAKADTYHVFKPKKYPELLKSRTPGKFLGLRYQRVSSVYIGGLHGGDERKAQENEWLLRENGAALGVSIKQVSGAGFEILGYAHRRRFGSGIRMSGIDKTFQIRPTLWAEIARQNKTTVTDLPSVWLPGFLKNFGNNVHALFISNLILHEKQGVGKDYDIHGLIYDTDFDPLLDKKVSGTPQEKLKEANRRRIEMLKLKIFFLNHLLQSLQDTTGKTNPNAFLLVAEHLLFGKSRLENVPLGRIKAEINAGVRAELGHEEGSQLIEFRDLLSKIFNEGGAVHYGNENTVLDNEYAQLIALLRKANPQADENLGLTAIQSEEGRRITVLRSEVRSQTSYSRSKPLNWPYLGAQLSVSPTFEIISSSSSLQVLIATVRDGEQWIMKRPINGATGEGLPGKISPVIYSHGGGLFLPTALIKDLKYRQGDSVRTNDVILQPRVSSLLEVTAASLSQLKTVQAALIQNTEDAELKRQEISLESKVKAMIQSYIAFKQELWRRGLYDFDLSIYDVGFDGQKAIGFDVDTVRLYPVNQADLEALRQSKIDEAHSSFGYVHGSHTERQRVDAKLESELWYYQSRASFDNMVRQAMSERNSEEAVFLSLAAEGPVTVNGKTIENYFLETANAAFNESDLRELLPKSSAQRERRRVPLDMSQMNEGELKQKFSPDTAVSQDVIEKWGLSILGRVGRYFIGLVPLADGSSRSSFILKALRNQETDELMARRLRFVQERGGGLFLPAVVQPQIALGAVNGKDVTLKRVILQERADDFLWPTLESHLEAGRVDNAKALLDDYVELIRGMWQQGLFDLDTSIFDIGVKNVDGKEVVIGYDTSDVIPIPLPAKFNKDDERMYRALVKNYRAAVSYLDVWKDGLKTQDLNELKRYFSKRILERLSYKQFDQVRRTLSDQSFKRMFRSQQEQDEFGQLASKTFELSRQASIAEANGTTVRRSEVRAGAKEQSDLLAKMQTSALAPHEIAQIAFMILPSQYRISAVSPADAAVTVLKGLETAKGEDDLRDQIAKFILSISEPATLSATAQAEARKLIESLKKISPDQVYAIGAIMPSDQKQMSPEFLTALIETVRSQSRRLEEVLLVGKGAAVGKVSEAVREAGVRPRQTPATKAPSMFNDQKNVPLIFGADDVVIRQIYQTLNKSFFPISANSSEADDPFILNYVEVLKVVVAIHTADLLSHDPKLLTNSEVLKQQLFERLFLAEDQFSNILKVDGKGIGINSTVARVYLAWKAAEAAAAAA